MELNNEMVLKDFTFPELKLPEDLSHCKPHEIEGLKDYIKWAKPIKIATGVFVTPDLNINHFIRDEIIDDLYSFSFRTWEEMIEYDPESDEYNPHALQKQNYGVCDNYGQILRYLPIVRDPRNFIVILTPIYKKHQPKRDGWRWEKWGEYIGIQNSKADYLYDEPEIEMIYVYHVYEMQ
jgi:hypothetical protein